MDKQTQQNQPTIHTTTGAYVAVIHMMAGIRLSLLNSENADAAGAQAETEFKPGDNLLGVFGIDEPFVKQLEKNSATVVPGYAGVGSATSMVPWLAISARPDGDVELDVFAAPTAIAANQTLNTYNNVSGNESRGVLSLEPVIFEGMKKFLRNRQPFDIKLM
jgi:hypothetical protein